MALFITVSGKMAKRMEEENRYGRMEHFMRDIGKMIWQMVRVDLFRLEEIAMKANGLMIKLRGRGSIIIMMALHIPGSGIMTNSMVMAMSNGVMDHNTKATMWKV